MVDRTICDAAQKIVTGAGATLIDCKIFRSGARYTVRCLVDYPGGGISVSDCAAINKRLVLFLEKEKGAYRDAVVEINSPGLDRRLHTEADFLRVKGRTILLWLATPVDGAAYIEGILTDVNDQGLHIAYKQKTLTVPFDVVKTGKEKIEI